MTRTKNNISATMGLPYEELVRVTGEKQRSIIRMAQKAQKIKVKPRGRVIASGSPYYMLGRKINIKGRRI